MTEEVIFNFIPFCFLLFHDSWSGFNTLCHTFMISWKTRSTLISRRSKWVLINRDKRKMKRERTDDNGGRIRVLTKSTLLLAIVWPEKRGFKDSQIEDCCCRMGLNKQNYIHLNLNLLDKRWEFNIKYRFMGLDPFRIGFGRAYFRAFTNSSHWVNGQALI